MHTRPSCVPSLHGCGWPLCLGLCFWICWIISTIAFFNRSSFSQSVTFFAFPGFLSMNTYSSVVLLLVVTLTSTTFTFVMIICLNNRLNFCYHHKFPLKHLLHLSKLWTICHFMSIQTIDVACIWRCLLWFLTWLCCLYRCHRGKCHVSLLVDIIHYYNLLY